MEWNRDERMLMILYVEKNLADTIAAMQTVRGKLQADETELDRMLSGLIRKLHRISEQEFEGIGA